MKERSGEGISQASHGCTGTLWRRTMLNVLALTIGLNSNGHGAPGWKYFAQFVNTMHREPSGYLSVLPPIGTFPLLFVWHSAALPGQSNVHFYVGCNGICLSSVCLAAAAFIFAEEHFRSAVSNHGLTWDFNSIDIRVNYDGDECLMGTIVCSDGLRRWRDGLLALRDANPSESKGSLQYDGNGILLNDAFRKYAVYTTDLYVQSTLNAARFATN
ncbi:hypothetical protein CONPUDRAFT_76052 [Coniophora puteana RWD-64-598 SS2]|uniref:Uncharacterized protein n=1 Tax=Coniophora puteana (strain RWD-64-598) TaxID=741705 RepID=A0A5M3MDG1_CONPW|nr:uncharacterized protein CONPUDRAFT_76052 [Coniophora puteana RWD-64-598 SS2]EIW77292.1 hypothetical protein CONPUDRAFT_76052 [Coniophora puteana RWD-64-598 SS2]